MYSFTDFQRQRFEGKIYGRTGKTFREIWNLLLQCGSLGIHHGEVKPHRIQKV